MASPRRTGACPEEEFNVAVLYTNQVMSNPDGGMSFVSDPKKPVGRHVLSKPSIIAIYHLQIAKIQKQFCITPYCTLVPPSSLTSFSRQGAITDITGYSGAEKP